MPGSVSRAKGIARSATVMKPGFASTTRGIQFANMPTVPSWGLHPGSIVRWIGLYPSIEIESWAFISTAGRWTWAMNSASNQETRPQTRPPAVETRRSRLSRLLNCRPRCVLGDERFEVLLHAIQTAPQAPGGQAEGLRKADVSRDGAGCDSSLEFLFCVADADAAQNGCTESRDVHDTPDTDAFHVPRDGTCREEKRIEYKPWIQSDSCN